jgi:glycosyltransferase involved in cell wall biosynthesis
VGQLIRRKGVLDLLDAYELVLKAAPDVQMLLVGTGQLERTLRERVLGRNLSGVHLMGHVSVSQLPKFYAVADCFVLPSHEEVWGLVLNEAAACSLPLITTEPVGAAADIVVPGTNGYIVPAADPAGLADAVCRVLDKGESMGGASRSIVSHMTYEQNAQAILSCVQHATA